MNDVYLVINKLKLKENHLSVDISFFDHVRPGDFVLYHDGEYEIRQKIYDPQDMDLYLVVEFRCRLVIPDEELETLVGDKRYEYHIRTGNTLQAIKDYKDASGCSLLEARDYIYDLKKRIGH